MTIAPIILEREADTAALGARLAPLLREGDAICLSGELGAGKSTLTRGLIKTLSRETEAPSPTFTLVQTYDADGFVLWHFDLYRLEKSDDVWELGLEEALDGGVLIIEWPERIENLIPPEALWIRLEIDGESRRADFRGGEDWRRRLVRAGIASW